LFAITAFMFFSKFNMPMLASVFILFFMPILNPLVSS
jgi:hypothetical protein